MLQELRKIGFRVIHTDMQHAQKDKRLSFVCIVWLDNPFPKVQRVLGDSPTFAQTLSHPSLWAITLPLKKKKSRDVLYTAIFCLWVYLVLPIHYNLRADTRSVSLSNPTSREKIKDVIKIISSPQGEGLSWMCSCNPTNGFIFLFLLKYFTLGF